jgi:peptidoglycan/xylan/chitin deacetylase (PgdA/CDA1 family)
VAEWPLGNRAALSLSFDNLGEAAEVQLGAAPMPSGPFGEHFTVTEVLPRILTGLRSRSLEATFFVEGVNADLYPDALATISQGHEIGYHAWCHEEWAALSASEQADNLTRGLAAFAKLSLSTTGMRPPGGLLGAGGLGTIREAGLDYCSPAGEGLGEEGGVAMVPFQWQHVDASCVLPPFGTVRKRMAGSPDPLEPVAFVEHIEGEVDRLAHDGGHLTIVLHPFMVDRWLGDDAFGALLDRVERAAKHEDVWVVPCAKVAEHVLANRERFAGVTSFDSASWSGAGDPEGA